MDSWIDIRRKARACHLAALRTTNGVRESSRLIQAALENDDLEIRRYDPGTTFPKGVLGSLDRASRLVNVAKLQDEADERLVISHEIGHFHLHTDPNSEVSVASSVLGGDAIETGVGRVEGYSPYERKEIQADIFAGEFLCPSDWLRDEFVTNKRSPADIAVELGIPPKLVLNQLIRALLLPPLREAAEAPESVHVGLDDSQNIAATWDAGPLLVDAGPGTGKTRTLVHRIKHLLDRGAAPTSILALTFSNKAAEEMRERISAVHPVAAIEIWVGTFHAFGLELLRKWPSAVGRTEKVSVLDSADSLAVLEENLEKLPLHHFQNLYDPALELVNVLRLISRCKDELLSPQDYLIAARADLVSATGEDLTAAEKAVEAGEIYQVYEALLQEGDAVDFGDLVLLATRLVRETPAVQAYIAGFKHVLVDEYQDVNLASSKLLQAICKLGARPWVVADQRQSIYRFRGAEPSNVTRFQDEFGGTHHSLTNNYRSFSPIVRTFEQFSGSMGGSGAMRGIWHANRGDGGGATMTVAATLAEEAEAIRDKIESIRSQGVPYRGQAILARSHRTLARITGQLEKLGVPLLYLGDLFERDEIRDLLSLVAIDAEFGGIGLIRVAAMPAYGATRDDALTVIRWARDGKTRIFDTLKLTDDIPGLSDRGRAGLAKLGRELDGLEYASPWSLLTKWLFERSEFLLPLLRSDDNGSRQKRIAIYHLLKVCSEQAARGFQKRKNFLAGIRRIEALNQDTSYRAIASEADDVDAVRVMTIHGSKGLEFGAVHFPAIATRYMPAQRQGVRCPPPRSLPQLALQEHDHEAEEECLFFVGLSRARNFLSLSRAERYTTTNSKPSIFLPHLVGTVRESRHQGRPAPTTLPVLRPPARRASYSERELSLYLECPAQYRYEAIEDLYGFRDNSAYIRFHRCVYVTLRWMEEQREKGVTVNEAQALAQLKTEWDTKGPLKHAFESYYRVTAETMVGSMAAVIAAENGRYGAEEWAVSLGSNKIIVTPDRVVTTLDGVVHVQRLRTGRETKSEADKPIYALLRLGSRANYPGKKISIETYYLAAAKQVPVPAKNDDKKLQKYTEAIASIELGEFEPAPGTRCPNCECYFMCGG